MGRHTLRLQAELLDRAVVPGVDFHVRLAVDTVGAEGADDAEREPVRVSAITCEWHGTERLDPAWVRPPKGVSASSSSRGGGASTSGGGLAPGERFFARSPASEVATDVVVDANKSLAFRVALCLPPGMPPSFRGSVARYAYAVTFIATAGGGERVVHRMPLPVETVSGVADGGRGITAHSSDAFLRAESSPSSSRSTLAVGSPSAASTAAGVASPVHPGRSVAGLARSDSLPPPESPGSPLDAVGLGGGSPTSNYPRSPSPFDNPSAHNLGASSADGKVAYSIALDDGSSLLRVIPRRPLPRCVAGGTVAGVLDFSDTDVDGANGADRRLRCTRVSVSLETEEVVIAGDLTDGESKSKSLEEREKDGECAVTRKVWAECSEWTGDTETTHFCLASPLDAPASFRTSRATLRWIARFEFIASIEAESGDEPRKTSGRGRERKLEWVMPLEMSGAFASAVRARGVSQSVSTVGDPGRAGVMARESSLLAS